MEVNGWPLHRARPRYLPELGMYLSHRSGEQSLAARSIKEGPSSTHFNGWEGSFLSDFYLFPLSANTWKGTAGLQMQIIWLCLGLGSSGWGSCQRKWDHLESRMLMTSLQNWQNSSKCMPSCVNASYHVISSILRKFRLFSPHTKEYIKAQFSKI